MKLKTYSLSCFVMMAGLALWLSVAAFNNFNDSNTNEQLLSHTLSMDLIVKDNNLGMGLVWRALPRHLGLRLLYFVIFLQAVISIMLWSSSYRYFKVCRYGSIGLLREAQNSALIALTVFQALWLFFLCGGLWMGYWLKQGAIQTVHMTLIVIGMCMLIYVTQSPTQDSILD